ncbi:MAG TPA: DUF554 family protein, partial [Archaeoglobaceae archaeon]|nr:DUF554 family protein [Archaeoglobaceae archaeon]
SSTLLFCVSSMAIVGPIQEGLTGDISILQTTGSPLRMA